MTGIRGYIWSRSLRAVLAAAFAILVLLPPTVIPATAAGDTRTLYLHHTHTKKTGRFTFKVNGRFDQNVLRQLNVFLADWRTHEPTKMDPALFDLLWTVYQEVRGSQPINIVSSYRSPKTNAMLRSKSSGVAENSQHVKGKAMDFFIPGVPLSKLRATAMRYQVGGVGYYPTSGSPFVHIDTGSVRAWPRMTRAQLQKVFPDGKTLHLPVDGKPLSSEGRRYAEAEWKKCRMVPCKGGVTVVPPSGDGEVVVASTGAPVPATPSPGILTALLDGLAPASEPSAPAQRMVATVDVAAPVPLARRGTGGQTVRLPGSGQLYPVPAVKSAALNLATSARTPEQDGETALAALESIGAAPVPQPRVLMSPKPETAEGTMVTAYVPAMEPDPGAQLALKMIIERETTASIAPEAAPQPVALHTASLGSQPPGGLDGLGRLLQDTWNAVSTLGEPPLQAALQARVRPAPNTAFTAHRIEFTAPDIDHVAETMVQPVLMSNVFFGEMYEPEGHLNKTTELGDLVTRIGFEPDPTIPAYDRFVPAAPVLVATR